jgi:predicted metal-binding protein
MDLLSKIMELVGSCDFTESGCLRTETLKYHPEIRKICEDNRCRDYGTSWACPPAVGTLAECRARVNAYRHMLLFSRKYELEDSFDFEAMTEGMLDFKKRVDRLQKELDCVLSDYLLMANEGCGRCSRCTYPDAPCRFPHLLHHSLEGYGFLVNELAAEAGIRYHNGENTVTFFGALLFNGH